MENEISKLYRIAAAINLLSETISDETGLLLSYLGEDIQEITEGMDNKTDSTKNRNKKLPLQ